MKGVYDVLRGSFLTDDRAVKNWRIIIFVVGLLLVMIWSSHSVDAKVLKIARLNKEKRKLRSEYIEGKTNLARIKLESSIKKSVKKMGLKPLEKPPQKIRLIIKKKL